MQESCVLSYSLDSRAKLVELSVSLNLNCSPNSHIQHEPNHSSNSLSGSALSLGGKHVLLCSTFAGYVVGLATTIVVMHVFKAAQPALLYIVPAVVAFPALHSFQQREFSKVPAHPLIFPTCHDSID